MDRVEVISGCDVTAESDLVNFVDRMNEKHVAGEGSEDGAFLYHINENIRWIRGREKEKQLLAEVVGAKVKDKSFTITVQSIKQLGPQCDVYHIGPHYLRIYDDNPDREAQEFIEKASDINSYITETCCSKIAASDGSEEDKATRMINHLFLEEVMANVVPIRNDKASDCDVSVLLEKGKILKETFEALEDTSEAVKFLVHGMTTSESCNDIECIELTDSEHEDEETQALPQKVRTFSWRRAGRSFSLYGATVTNAHPVETESKDIRQSTRVTEHFNMSFLRNMLFLMPIFLPGLHSSFLYIGTNMSVFPAHFEDGLLWSLNYLYMGAPKIWIIIPPHATCALDTLLSRSGVLLAHSSCRNLLGHKIAFPTVYWLKEHKIPFKVVIQRPGDMVVLMPDAVHYGFNTGFNIAQAINFATESWLPLATQQRKCNCYGNSQIHLDIAPLLAAFRPDLLRGYLCRQLIALPYQDRSLQLQYSSITGQELKDCNDRPKASKKNKTDSESKERFFCPVLKCQHSVMKGTRCVKQIIQHLSKRHSAHPKYQYYVDSFK